MTDTIYWIMLAAVWGLGLLPAATYLFFKGERKKARIVLMFGFIGSVPGIMGHLGHLNR